MSSIEILTEIKNVFGTEWKQKLVDYLSTDLDSEERVEEQFNSFFEVYREDVIEGNSKAKKEVEKFINNDLVFSNLNKSVEETLANYRASASIRAMEKKNLAKTKKHIEEIFKKAVLRFYPEIIDEYMQYGFESYDAFTVFLNTFTSLCEFIVERNFYYNSIMNAIHDNMRVSDELCEHISSLLDENFEKLKLNLILKKLTHYNE